MKKILALLLILPLVLLLPVIGLSKSNDKNEAKVKNEILCLSIDKAAILLKDFGQVSVFGMFSIENYDDEKKTKLNEAMFFANPEDKTWFLIEKRNDKYCVLGFGAGLEVVRQKGTRI